MVFLDTVGFISNLPHALFAAFKATLDEIKTAQVVLHVRDVAHYEAAFQKESVLGVLAELQVPAPLLRNHIEVWNKIDLLEPAELESALDAVSPRGVRFVLPSSACATDGP